MMDWTARSRMSRSRLSMRGRYTVDPTIMRGTRPWNPEALVDLRTPSGAL
jgi:hypothetical protein